MSKRKVVTKYYEKHNVGIEYKGLVKKHTSYLYTKIGKLLDLKENPKILDIACGIGESGIVLKKKMSADVYGIDLSESAVKISKRKGVKAVVADIDKRWPHKNSFFDLVLSSQTIEHLYNPDNLILESRRVLKKNGVLVVVTPNLACWINRVIFIFGYQPFFTEVSTVDKTLGLDFTRRLSSNREPVGHLRVFSLRALKDMLKFYDFSIIKSMGLEVDFLPKYMKIFDKFFSCFPSLATNVVVVAKKK
jgi:SAM-dependent methyltransferase